MTMSDGVLGGAEDLARQIAQRLDRERFESTLAVTRWSVTAETEPVLAELRAAGTGFIGLERGSRFDLRPWRRLLIEMRDRQIDVLHSHKIGSNFWGALLAPRVPVPVFVAHEHTWSWEGQLHRRLIDRYLIARRANAFVAVSRADRRRMTEIEGIPPEKTRYIPIAIAEPTRTEDESKVRAELGVGSNEQLVALVGTLRRQKAYEAIIEAATILRRETPAIKIVIVGGEDPAGPGEHARLQGMIDRLGVGDTIRLLGYRSNPFNVVCACEVCVQCSDFEGSPQSIKEFMKAAKPVVATRVGGVPDLVRDGETGILVQPRNPAALASAITELARDPERRERMGRAGRELVRREFSMESMLTAIEALYEELYEAGGVGGGSR
jgi:glycosyltransferase involved in cell wall biosynthesis